MGARSEKVDGCSEKVGRKSIGRGRGERVEQEKGTRGKEG